MQEQNEQEIVKTIGKLDKKNIIWVSVCCVLMLAVLVSGIVIYRHLPTAHWRESHTDFPWKATGVTVTAVKSHWQSSKGDSRMELRAAFYPAASITLGEVGGSGYLLVRFLDEDGCQSSETIYLPYGNGTLGQKVDGNVNAGGKEAKVRSEIGFPTADDFHRHALLEERPLWRTCIWNRPSDGRQDEFMGYVTIPATDKEK